MALTCCNLYNNTAKKRSYYVAPMKITGTPFHIWKSLVEKAGYKISDIPNMLFLISSSRQDKLHTQGMRNVYAYGYQLTANGGDPIATFNAFMIAYGGKDFVTSDGKLRTDAPQIREAAVKALVKLTTPFKEGYGRPGSSIGTMPTTTTLCPAMFPRHGHTRGMGVGLSENQSLSRRWDPADLSMRIIAFPWLMGPTFRQSLPREEPDQTDKCTCSRRLCTQHWAGLPRSGRDFFPKREVHERQVALLRRSRDARSHQKSPPLPAAATYRRKRPNNDWH